MNNAEKRVVLTFLKKIGSKGGTARASRHSKTELSKWGKLGGRPRKKSLKRGTEK